MKFAEFDNATTANKGLPKYGLDQQNFSFNSFSAFVPGWTNLARLLHATSNFSHKFIFSSGQTEY
jgi:hypothetical protein